MSSQFSCDVVDISLIRFVSLISYAAFCQNNDTDPKYPVILSPIMSCQNPWSNSLLDFNFVPNTLFNTLDFRATLVLTNEFNMILEH